MKTRIIIDLLTLGLAEVIHWLDEGIKWLKNKIEKRSKKNEKTDA